MRSCNGDGFVFFRDEAQCGASFHDLKSCMSEVAKLWVGIGDSWGVNHKNLGLLFQKEHFRNGFHAVIEMNRNAFFDQFLGNSARCFVVAFNVLV